MPIYAYRYLHTLASNGLFMREAAMFIKAFGNWLHVWERDKEGSVRESTQQIGGIRFSPTTL